MIDLHQHIDNIVKLGSVTPREVGAVLGVTLKRVKESPYTDFYEGGPAGVVEEASLALSRTSLKWHVAWTYAPNQAPREEDIDLSRYGSRLDTEVNPRIPPEGAFSYVYDYMGFKLLIQFTTRSKRLRGVGLHKE